MILSFPALSGGVGVSGGGDYILCKKPKLSLFKSDRLYLADTYHLFKTKEGKKN
jgi:hypothetical protein